MNQSNARPSQTPDDSREPFVALPVSAHRDPMLSSDDVRILMEIASRDWATNDHGCTASQATLAENCSVSESTVKRAIKRLHIAGYLLAPQAVFRGRERVGTTLKLSGKVRPGRPLASAVVDSPVRRTSPPSEKRQKHFAVRFRPDIERMPLTAEDAARLRLLDEWGCADSEDMLGIMLSVIANRERSCGRAVDADRVRKLFDSAAKNRRFGRISVTNRTGLLLDGLERGYLLTHGPRLEMKDLPPGAREALGILIDRAAAGSNVSEQTLMDYGVDRADFTRYVDQHATQHPQDLGDAAPTSEREEEEDHTTSDVVAGGAAADGVREALRKRVDQPAFEMLLARTGISVDEKHVLLGAPHAFIADLLRLKIVPILESLGFEATVHSS